MNVTQHNIINLLKILVAYLFIIFGHLVCMNLVCEVHRRQYGVEMYKAWMCLRKENTPNNAQHDGLTADTLVPT